MNTSEMLLYKTTDGSIKKATVSRHISNIFKEIELDSKVVVRDYRTTTQHEAIEAGQKPHGDAVWRGGACAF